MRSELPVPRYKWSSVKETLPLHRKRPYFSRRQYGCDGGTEPVRYVTRILTYYDILRNQSRS